MIVFMCKMIVNVITKVLSMEVLSRHMEAHYSNSSPMQIVESVGGFSLEKQYVRIVVLYESSAHRM